MLLRNLSELPNLLKPGQCLLGLDYGSKIIGVAISDPGLKVASPIGSINRQKPPQDASALLRLIKDRNIGGIIIGLPKNLAGGDSSMAQAARAFMRNITAEWRINNIQNPDPDLPILFWDERFSTAAVERFLISGDVSRGRRKEIIDKSTAAYILQGALDALLYTSYSPSA